MKKELEKWLENNPPRVKLTELEKTIKLEDLRPDMYFVYLDEKNDTAIYRLCKVSAMERVGWSILGEKSNDASLDYLAKLWKSLGFCPLGYDFTELHEINNMFGSDFQTIF